MKDIDDLVRRARPAVDTGWARGAEGQRVLTHVLTGTPATSANDRSRRRRWRLRPVLSAAGGVAVLAGTAAAAVVALAPEPPPTWTVPGGTVACANERSAEADLAFQHWTAGTDPADTCRQYWIDTTGTAPEKLFPCVYRKGGAGGGVVVIPGDGYGGAAQACATINMFVAPANLVPGPTDTNVSPPRPVDGATPAGTSSMAPSAAAPTTAGGR
ncbi:hypothetical protein [Micromonospora foliorum]|uniref:hypothetical protein n=1 Tax=Micromonospora foliorum TaxID=2911210 RepID=UPI001EE8425A|nr:hypothetical protein [Micromonospora foliorum]MCG5435235.1 hypothetical protein [Micromonospora foliorum]